MPYSKTLYVNNSTPAINATNLNKMEDGIEQAVNHAESTHAPVTADNTENYLDTNTGIVNLYTLTDLANTFNITPAKITVFTSTLLNTNGHFTVNTVDQEVTAVTGGVHRVHGVVGLEAPINEVIYMQLAIDGVPLGIPMPITGRGDGKPISIPYSAIHDVVANSVISIYGYSESNGIAVTIKSSTITAEKTHYSAS